MPQQSQLMGHAQMIYLKFLTKQIKLLKRMKFLHKHVLMLKRVVHNFIRRQLLIVTEEIQHTLCTIRAGSKRGEEASILLDLPIKVMHGKKFPEVKNIIARASRKKYKKISRVQRKARLGKEQKTLFLLHATFYKKLLC